MMNEDPTMRIDEDLNQQDDSVIRPEGSLFQTRIPRPVYPAKQLFVVLAVLLGTLALAFGVTKLR